MTFSVRRTVPALSLSHSSGTEKIKEFFFWKRERVTAAHLGSMSQRPSSPVAASSTLYCTHPQPTTTTHTTKKEYFFFSFPLWSSNFLATQETVCLEFSQLLRSRDSWTRVPSSRLFYYIFDSHTFDVFVFTIVLTSNCFRLRAVTKGATRLVFFFFFLLQRWLRAQCYCLLCWLFVNVG